MPNNYNEIIEKNFKDIHYSIDYYLVKKHYYERNSDIYQDLYQIILLKLVERIKDFNPNKGKITTFTQMICRNALSRQYKKENTMKNLVYNQSRMLFDDDHVYKNFEEDITNKIFLETCLEKIGNEISHYHRDIFNDYLNSKRIGDIAVDYKILSIDVYDIIDDCVRLLKSKYKNS